LSWSICAFSLRILAISAFSACQRALRALESSRSLANSFSICLRRSTECASVSFSSALALDFELQDAALDLVNFRGQRIDLHAQAGGGFIDQVDGLVWQEAIGDVAVRKSGGGQDGGVLDAHAVMNFVAVLEAAEDRDGVLHAGFGHKNRWKRRSSAGSFSMYFLYSLMVVAPIARNSPRASAGFSILEASMAPSAAPAPTSV